MSSLGAALVCAAMASCGGGGGAADTAGVAQAGSATALAAAPVSAPAADTTALTLRASVAGFDGDAATLQVRHNDSIVGTLQVRTTELADLRIDVPSPVDGGVLELVWQNAADAAGRSVTVDQIVVSGTTLSPLGNGVVFDRGDGPAAFDGMDLVPGQRTLTQGGALRFVLAAGSRSIAATAAASRADTAAAPGFYVDAGLGNDSNPGTLDKPWRTLARLQTARLAAGQGFYLRCGSLWRESLSLSATQLVDGSAITGYGSECSTKKAVISGADDFSGGWQKSGGVWSRSLPSGTPKITQLIVDGQALRTAQWPNAEAGARRAALFAADTSATKTATLQAGDVASLAGKDVLGATVQVRTQPWFVETRRVLSAGDGRLELDKSTNWTIEAGEGFVLQDKLWMLDVPGEFFHDTAAQRLYLIAPTAGVPADLNKAGVEGSVRDVALALTERSHLVVRDVALRAAREDGLRMTDTPQARIERIEARDNMSAGVRLWQWAKIPAATPGPSITDSLVSGNGQYGIDAQYVNGAQIKRNRVLATGTSAHQLTNVFAAIAAGPGAATEDNVVDGSAYIGIRFSALGGSLVARNTVSGYCSRLSDCGAIYTWTGRDAAAAAAALGTSTSGLASTVQGNRVLPAQAQLEGAVADGRDVVAGIYIDDRSHQAQVLDNVVVGAPVGVFVHNASGVRVSGNRIWQPTAVGLWASMDEREVDSMVGNRFSDNTVVPLLQAEIVAGSLPALASSQAVWFWHAMAGEAALAPARNHFSGNRVLQLQGALAVHARVRGPAGERALDAEEWRAVNPAELAAQRPLLYPALAATLGDELVADGGFDGGLAAWRSHRNPASASFAAQAVPSAQGCTGACISFTAGDPGDLLASRPFALRPGAVYAYRLRATFAHSGSIAPPYISRDGTPWDSMANARGFVSSGPLHGAAGETLAYEAFFVARAAEPSRVNLQLRSYGSAVALDAVSVREVVSWTAARSSDWSALAYARPDAARAVDCIQLGWPAGCTALGLDGQPVPLPLQLAAGTERLLLRGDSPLRR